MEIATLLLLGGLDSLGCVLDSDLDIVALEGVHLNVITVIDSISPLVPNPSSIFNSSFFLQLALRSNSTATASPSRRYHPALLRRHHLLAHVQRVRGLRDLTNGLQVLVVSLIECALGR